MVGVEPAVPCVNDAHLAGLAGVLGETGPAVLPFTGVPEELAEERVALLVARVLAGVRDAPRIKGLGARHAPALVGNGPVRAQGVVAVVALLLLLRRRPPAGTTPCQGRGTTRASAVLPL